MINVPGFNVYRNNGEWTIEQQLGSISIYDLCGGFDEAVKRLKSEQEFYEEYTIEPGRTAKKLVGNGYCELKFDSIFLEKHWGEDRVIEVRGRRKPIQEELEYLEKNRLMDEEKARKEREKQWKALKKEFGS